MGRGAPFDWQDMMRFTFRDLGFDFALLLLAAMAWFYTDRPAVRETVRTAIATVLGH